MSNLISEFKNLIKGEVTDSNMLVPMLEWSSASEQNIENSQDVNKLFKHVHKDVLSRRLSYNNNCKNFVKYPSKKKDDEKLDFFINDICSYFGWSKRELNKNKCSIDIDSLRETIATAYGYNNSQRKIIGLSLINN